MAFENITADYTHVGTATSGTSSRITYTGVNFRNVTDYWYKAYAISADVTHQCTSALSANDTGGGHPAIWAIADTIADARANQANNIWYVNRLGHPTGQLTQGLIYEAGAFVDFFSYMLGLGTFYYDFVIDIDGGSGSGRLTVLIYSDAIRSTLVTTQTMDASAVTPVTLTNYFFPNSSYNTGAGGLNSTGYIENYDLGGVAGIAGPLVNGGLVNRGLINGGLVN